ncbi:pyrroline-5-carboxylate reductase [Gemella cuniculi]|uniref:pyrroline-5-carboxylate reductase n=1 Tax=Gemella cuniculi TaxID=150240 RepID=UPI00040F29F6|nr:pyrroline-5-carboxylate reductase [Gemella cuniculi]
MKLGFIGAGNMGEAILKGIVSGGRVNSTSIFVRNSSDKSTENIARKYGINFCVNLVEVARSSDVVFLGVKPYLVAGILEEIKDELQGKIIISMAAAVEIGDIEDIVPSGKIVRIMPNTPVEVGKGVIGITFNKKIEKNDQINVLELFSNIGKTEIILEKDMQALTALSGSGPAYVYMFIEALADGAVLNGLRRDVAYRLAANTVLGAAQMVLETKKHPGELKDDVCSPAGSTIEAVKILESKGFRSAVIDCEYACYNKLKEMK